MKHIRTATLTAAFCLASCSDSDSASEDTSEATSSGSTTTSGETDISDTTEDDGPPLCTVGSDGGTSTSGDTTGAVGSDTGGSETTGGVDAPYDTQPFTMTYAEGDFGIAGIEPDLPGEQFPVFVYVIGTNGDYVADHAMHWLETMAPRGFVAATVEYDNGLFSSCNHLRDRAQAIFAAEDPESAAFGLCARQSADCGRGIVVAGHSQGSLVALLAADFNPDVAAAVPTGTGYRLAGAVPNFAECIVEERVLPNDRVRAVTGASDPVWGGLDAKIQQLSAMTGEVCESSWDCTTDGHGWHLIPDRAVADSDADHCFFAIGNDCSEELDPAWSQGQDPWAVPALLDFLQSHTL